ncbi:hypothetical protein [Sphingomonas azotifigens]|uniref:hypothetical protein n=1 Tax=Sphingomonas azotifigens TaxID=330920 RepID=UPI000A05B8F5|nr:hypothetical protein [Sphingomonas azotifigens]
MAKVFLVAPTGIVTGGTELSQQLGHSLRRHGVDARMLYTPFDQPAATPEAFIRYDVPVASLDDMTPGDIVVLPEAFPRLLPMFKGMRIYFWWMSVDNFFMVEFSRLARMFPRWLYARGTMARLRQGVDVHLYQSDYARQFLEANKLGRAESLTDYLAQEYLDGIETAANATARENLLVYNPKKGAERTALILAELERRGRTDIKPAPLQNMNRDQVKDLLTRAKLYIDFGGHPGKDRIPREAAAKGACILTNKRGSAANARDVAIDEYYKVDDTRDGFAVEAVDRIIAIMDDFGSHAPRFDRYRASIAAEPARFEDEVRAVFGIQAAH